MNTLLWYLVLAQTAIPDPGADAGGFIGVVLKSLAGHNWLLLAAAVCIGLTWALRNYGSKWIPWFATDRGGAIMVMAIGVVGGIGAALAEGTFSWASILNGVILGLASAGGYVVPKRILKPADAGP